jgi:hypothetical protein
VTGLTAAGFDSDFITGFDSVLTTVFATLVLLAITFPPDGSDFVRGAGSVLIEVADIFLVRLVTESCDFAREAGAEWAGAGDRHSSTSSTRNLSPGQAMDKSFETL